MRHNNDEDTNTGFNAEITPAEPLMPKQPIPAPKPSPSYGMVRVQDSIQRGLTFEKLHFAATLPFTPRNTETLLELTSITELPLDKIRYSVHGLILDVEGTLKPEGATDFSPEIIEKLRQIKAKMKVCVFADNDLEYGLFADLRIPIVKNAPPKPEAAGFIRAAHNYLDLEAHRCAMVGDNILTDGGANQTGMHVILVDPLPGKESMAHRLVRGYGRMVKTLHDGMYSFKKKKQRG